MTDHGGDWAGFTETYGAPPLDFSANVSPLGVPEAVRQAAEAALAEAERTPCAAPCGKGWRRITTSRRIGFSAATEPRIWSTGWRRPGGMERLSSPPPPSPSTKTL